MKRNFFTALISCALFVAFTIPTTSAVVFLAQDELSSSEPILDDAYVAGGMVTMESDIEGDLYVVGGSLMINGDISGDLVIVGGQITVNGNVGDDLRATGGSIFINGNVGDDLIAPGGQVNIASESLIGGSLILGSGFANILGTINENILGGGGKIVLGGTVYGDVQVEVQETITLTEKAKINGNLIYTGLRKAELNEDQVEGFIEYNELIVENTNLGENIKGIFSKLHIIFQVFQYLSMLVLAFVIVMLAPATLIGAAEIAKARPWKSLGLGLVIALCSIASIIVLSITIIGLPLAGMLLAILCITMCLAKVYAGAFIGKMLINPKKMTRAKLFWISALGIFVIEIVGLVPFIGWIIAFLTVIIGFGALWTHKKDLYGKLNLQKI